MYFQINREENEWLVKTENAQKVIQESIKKIQNSEISDERIKQSVDNAYANFVTFVKNDLKPVFEKVIVTKYHTFRYLKIYS